MIIKKDQFDFFLQNFIHELLGGSPSCLTLFISLHHRRVLSPKMAKAPTGRRLVSLWPGWFVSNRKAARKF